MDSMNCVSVLFGKASNHGAEMGFMTEFEDACLPFTWRINALIIAMGKRCILRGQHRDLI